MKKNILKSITFIVLYAIATVAISHIKEGKEILDIFQHRWYEYVILFIVLIWFNNFMDKKSKKANKNKFYKDL